MIRARPQSTPTPASFGFVGPDPQTHRNLESVPGKKTVTMFTSACNCCAVVRLSPTCQLHLPKSIFSKGCYYSCLVNPIGPKGSLIILLYITKISEIELFSNLTNDYTQWDQDKLVIFFCYIIWIGTKRTFCVQWAISHRGAETVLYIIWYLATPPVTGPFKEITCKPIHYCFMKTSPPVMRKW